ncbi:hypothetical protein N9N28_17295 [Rubripirellula amarantea]|nr:hypothetical protein [Rubripirellula amarantea]
MRLTASHGERSASIANASPIKKTTIVYLLILVLTFFTPILGSAKELDSKDGERTRDLSSDLLIEKYMESLSRYFATFDLGYVTAKADIPIDLSSQNDSVCGFDINAVSTSCSYPRFRY